MSFDAGSGSVAVVTGAASGIGKATATALGEAGFGVVGMDLNQRPEELADASWLDWVQGDVSAGETWQTATKLCHARDALGASAFVACAADVSAQPFLETPQDEWRRLFENNVIGVVCGLQALIPAMVERGRGAVVVTCSVSSLFAEPDLAAYAASKAALLSLTRTVALEHASDGLRVNAVCPGSVDTPLLRKHVDSLDDPAAALAAMRRRIPTGELTRAEEVAALTRFLVTEEASGLAGAAVVLDGGLTAAYEFGAFSAA